MRFNIIDDFKVIFVIISKPEWNLMGAYSVGSVVCFLQANPLLDWQLYIHPKS